MTINTTFTAKWTGFDGTPLILAFPGSAAESEFQPQFAGDGIPDNHLYVILRHDPDRPSVGKVLGTLALRQP